MDLETSCSYDRPPLFVAVDYGSYNTYRYLLKQKVNLNASSPHQTALIRAIAHRQYDMTYELIRLGALAHKRHDTSALEYALLYCDPILVAALMEAGASVDERYNYVDETPLHRAANSGCLNSAEILLTKGAAVNAETKYGQTPLFNAVMSGSHYVVNLLIEAGATVDHKDHSGSTPLLFAVSYGYSAIITLLLDAGADSNRTYSYTTGSLPFAIPTNVDLRDAIQFGATVLMIGAARGDMKTVESLLRNKADPTAIVKGKRGMHTSSTIAAKAGYSKLSELLKRN